MDTAERAQHFAESVSLVFFSQLAVLQLTLFKRLQNDKKSVRFHAQSFGCFIKRTVQDLMVIKVEMKYGTI